MGGQGDLAATLAKLQKKWGTQALQVGRHDESPPGLATGWPDLDALMGGGLPRGRLTQLLGQPTSGMTTLALGLTASAQREGEVVVYLDLSLTFDAEYAVACQVAVADLLLVRPARADEALDILFDVVATGIPGLVIFSSFANPPRPVLEVLQRLNPALTRSRCVLLLLTPPPVTLPTAAVRLHLHLQTWLTAGRDVAGYRVRVTVRKHPTLAAGQFVDLDLLTAGGRP